MRLVWGKREGAGVTESGWELELQCYSEDLGLFLWSHLGKASWTECDPYTPVTD